MPILQGRLIPNWGKGDWVTFSVMLKSGEAYTCPLATVVQKSKHGSPVFFSATSAALSAPAKQTGYQPNAPPKMDRMTTMSEARSL